MQTSDWQPRKFMTMQDFRRPPVLIAGSLAVLTVGTLIYFSFFNNPNRGTKKSKTTHTKTTTDRDIKKTDSTHAPTPSEPLVKTNKPSEEQSQKTEIVVPPSKDTTIETDQLKHEESTTEQVIVKDIVTDKGKIDVVIVKEKTTIPLKEKESKEELAIDIDQKNAQSDEQLKTKTAEQLVEETQKEIVEETAIEEAALEAALEAAVDAIVEAKIKETTKDTVKETKEIKDDHLEDSMVILELTEDINEDELIGELDELKDNGMEESMVILELTESTMLERTTTDAATDAATDTATDTATETTADIPAESKDVPKPVAVNKDLIEEHFPALPTQTPVEPATVAPSFNIAPSKTSSSSSSGPSTLAGDKTPPVAQTTPRKATPSAGNYWAQPQGQPAPLYNMQWQQIFTIDQENAPQSAATTGLEDKTNEETVLADAEGDKNKKKFKKYMTRTQMIESQHQKYTPPIKARCNHWPACTNKKCKFHHPYIICR
ncbi:hypothetical protein F4703DRAFT_1821543 [Phycomyces blakesleeanus]